MPSSIQGSPTDGSRMSTTAEVDAPIVDVAAGRPARRRSRFRVRGNEIAILGALLVGLLVIVALLAPVLATHDPERLSMTTRLRPPSHEFWFGTDEFGRDLYSRIVYGSRISLLVAATVILIATAIGVTLGAIGAYRGGRWDEGVMRLADVFMAFPDLVLAMALSAAFGANLTSAIVAVSIVYWPTYARLIRGQVLSLKQH